MQLKSLAAAIGAAALGAGLLTAAGIAGGFPAPGSLTATGGIVGGSFPPAPAPYQPGDLVWTTPPPATGVEIPGLFLAPSNFPAPPPPYQPGDKVWTTPPPVPTSATPDANDCQRVPATGYISHDNYAQTSGEYANFWSWTGSSSIESFSWYIKKSSGTIVAHGASPGGGGSQSVGANIDYWQVQNGGVDPQAWTACYSVQ